MLLPTPRASAADRTTRDEGRFDGFGETPRLELLATRTDQALDDIARAGAAEVVFVRHARTGTADEYLTDIEQRASASGFATARLAIVTDCAFDELAALVAAILRNVRPPSSHTGRARRGLTALLDAFIARAGARAAAADLGARLDADGLAGDVARLARAYVASSANRAELARIDAWLSGVELARADADAVAALSSRTAKRALRDMTRLVRALGYRGTVVLLHDGDIVTRLPPARRTAAYATLRELVDNADGGRGLVAAQIVVAGSTSLFAGPRSLATYAPLATRIAPADGSAVGAPPPHRPLIDLATPEAPSRAPRPLLRPAPDGATIALGTVLRAAHGLPPIAATPELSVGHERIDRSIDALFEHTTMDGSVFSLLCGAYGSGKTHFLLHLAAHALADNRPVLRLSVEHVDADLGHPERHVARLIEQASLPPDGALGPLDRLTRWTSSPRAFAKLEHALEAIAAEASDASPAARKALVRLQSASNKVRALDAYLDGSDLARRAPSPATRRDAYGLVLLWFALLERLDGCAGPVVLIDEAEALYRGGATRAERRTALRSLSFYCGGALPRACVVLALTPGALDELRAEAPALLDDVSEQRTLLPVEDAEMLCRRLRRTRPIEVPALTRAQRIELAERVRATHASVRGPLVDPGWEAQLPQLIDAASPRELVRRTIDRLERLWWRAPAASELGSPVDGPRPRAKRLRL